MQLFWPQVLATVLQADNTGIATAISIKLRYSGFHLLCFHGFQPASLAHRFAGSIQMSLIDPSYIFFCVEFFPGSMRLVFRFVGIY